MKHELLISWVQQKWKKAPYIFDGDRDALPDKKIVYRSCYEDFIRQEEFYDHHRSQFHTGLIPVPFHGHLECADIFICLTNPGLNVLDYYVEEIGTYRDCLFRNLKQSRQSEDYPFLPLDPQWHWTSGGQWWNSLFRSIIVELREQGVAKSYADAAKIISKRTAALELVPYHSRGGGHVAGLVGDLKSSILVKDFFNTWVMPKARKGDALVVVVSGLRMWEVEPHQNVIHPSEKKGPKANLSMRKHGAGSKILDRLLNYHPRCAAK